MSHSDPLNAANAWSNWWSPTDVDDYDDGYPGLGNGPQQASYADSQTDSYFDFGTSFFGSLMEPSGSGADTDSYPDSYPGFADYESPEPLLRETDFDPSEVDTLIGSDWMIPTMDYERETLPAQVRDFATNQASLNILNKFPWDDQRAPGQPFRDTQVAPQEAFDLFNWMDGEEKGLFVHQAPEAIGALDGAPVDLRYAANVQLMGDRYEAINDRLLDLDPKYTRTVGDMTGTIDNKYKVEIQHLEREREMLKLLANGDPGIPGNPRRPAIASSQVLLFDPYAGHLATVRGNLESATDVVTYINGVGHSYDVFGDQKELVAETDFAQRKGQYSVMRRQENIVAELARQGGENTATVAWVGYNAPSTVLQPATALSHRAEAGADDLVRFYEGMEVNAQGRDVNQAVFAHSYGSIVTGRSIRYHGLGNYADRVFLIGSPGVDVNDPDELSSEGFDQPEIYTMMADNDPIKYSGDYFHGDRPAYVGEWLRLDAQDADGHSEYFDLESDSLEFLVRVALSGYPAEEGP